MISPILRVKRPLSILVGCRWSFSFPIRSQVLHPPNLYLSWHPDLQSPSGSELSYRMWCVRCPRWYGTTSVGDIQVTASSLPSWYWTSWRARPTTSDADLHASGVLGGFSWIGGRDQFVPPLDRNCDKHAFLNNCCFFRAEVLRNERNILSVSQKMRTISANGNPGKNTLKNLSKIKWVY